MEVFSSNAVRLSIREWIVVLAVLAVAALFTGDLWRRIEPFEPGRDYRLPYALSEDYWLFDRLCRATPADRTLVLGDSVIWGQYVAPDRTLTHFLNRLAGAERFVNAGLDGAHPLALGGLIEHHCGGVDRRALLVHLNLLWLSSPQSDLESARTVRLNHPRLLPQFDERPPAYQAPLTERIGIVASRHVPVLNWARHLQMASFGGADLARWSVSHPYANPIAAVTLRLPNPASDRIRRAESSAVRATPRDLPWVPLERSWQWRAFTRLVETLRHRGARLTVIIGPLNEHMLTTADVETHRRLAAGAEAWLRAHDVEFYSPAALPRELYADLSHPLAGGYALLAERLWTIQSFRD